jgi:hypothetical protein
MTFSHAAEAFLKVLRQHAKLQQAEAESIKR